MAGLNHVGRRSFPAASLALAAWIAAAGTAGAQTSYDWNQYNGLLAQFTQAADNDQPEAAAAAAERIDALVRERFDPRLDFLGTILLGDARLGQSRFDEAIDLYSRGLERCQAFRPLSAIETAVANLHTHRALRGLGNSHSRKGNPRQSLEFSQAAVDWTRERFADQPVLIAETELELGGSQMENGDIAAADKTYRQAVAVYEAAAEREPAPGKRTAGLARALNLSASIHMARGRYDLAEPVLHRALALCVASRGAQSRFTAEIASNLGLLYHVQGRPETGLPYQDAALRIWESTIGPSQSLTEQAVTRMAMALIATGRPAEAEPLFRRALASAEARYGRDHINTAEAMTGLAAALCSLNRAAEAEPLLAESLAIHEKTLGADDDLTQIVVFVVGTTALEQGKLAEARRALDRLSTSAPADALDRRGNAHLHRFRAELLWKEGRRQEAIDAMSAAIAVVEIQRGYLSGAERERAALLNVYGGEYEFLAHWQAECGDVAGLFATLESGKARGFLDELRMQNVDLSQGLSDAERQRNAEREALLREAVSRAEAAYFKLPSDGSGTKDERRRAADAVLAARDELYQHLTDVRTSSPLYRELITNQTRLQTLADLQAQLAEGEVFLSYSIGETFGSYVVVVRRDDAYLAPLILDAADAAALGVAAGPLKSADLSEALLHREDSLLPVLSTGGDTALAERLAALWRALVPERERTQLLDGGVKLLTVSPDGPLTLLPFEALVVASDAGPTFLLDSGPPIAYAPSATALANLAQRQDRAASPREPILTLGDPAYEAAERRPTGDDAEDSLRAGLSRLPYSGHEARWVGEHFTNAGRAVVQLTRREASEGRLRELIEGRELVHLACHGLTDHEFGNMFGALALTPVDPGNPADDGFLHLNEVYQLDLDGCEAAVLSACKTNYGPQQKGEGVWALSRGFLVAGARRVVASNWVVDDEAGATLVSYFAGTLAQADAAQSRRDYALALQKAKRQVRQNPKWRHPFYWSSLILLGPR